MFDYTGAIHMHSTFSDGTAKPDEIAGYANEVGLDYILLTDHNTLQAKTLGYEKKYGNTLLIAGYEINDMENKNHYLTFGLDKLVGNYKDIGGGEFGNTLPASEYVKLVNENGGFGFIAHPFEKRNSFPQHPPYPWTEWKIDNYNGIEIWNHMSEWIEGLTENNQVNRFLHPLKSIVAPDINAVKKWDTVNKHRKLPAIGCIDAHAHKISLIGFYNVEVFPYKVLFKSVRTNVILDEELDKNNFAKSSKMILNAIKSGKSYIVNSYYGEAKGFRFFARKNGEYFSMGDDIYSNNTSQILLECFLPKQARVRLMKNGECIDESTSTGGIWNCEGYGNYRIECWINDKAWIFSNNIRILKN